MHRPPLLALALLCLATPGCRRGDVGARAKRDDMPIVPDRPSTRDQAPTPTEQPTPGPLRVARRSNEGAMLYRLGDDLFVALGERYHVVQRGDLVDTGEIKLGPRAAMIQGLRGVAMMGRYPEAAYAVFTDHLSRIARAPEVYRHKSGGWAPEKLAPEGQAERFFQAYPYTDGRIVSIQSGQPPQLLVPPDERRPLPLDALCAEGEKATVHQVVSSNRAAVIAGWCSRPEREARPLFAVARGDKLERLEVEGLPDASTGRAALWHVATSPEGETHVALSGPNGDGHLCRIDGAVCKPVALPARTSPKASVRIWSMAATSKGLHLLTFDQVDSEKGAAAPKPALRRLAAGRWSDVTIADDVVDGAAERLRISGIASHGRALWLTAFMAADADRRPAEHLVLTDEALDTMAPR